MAKQPAVPIDGRYIRLTMFMSQGTTTITESHWVASQDPTQMQTLLNNSVSTTPPYGIAYDRWYLLASFSQMTEIRCSQENVYKDSLVTTDCLGFSGSNPANATINQSNDGLEFRIEM